MKTEEKYYKFFDGLRAIAVLGAITYHAFIFFNFRDLLGQYFAPLRKFTYMGMFGVDIFFVISGFLITGLLLEDFNKRKIDLGKFYLRRIFKIFPQYYFVVGVSLLLLAFIPPFTIDGIEQIKSHKAVSSFDALVFIQNLTDKCQPILAHLWSVAIEIQFYIFFPLMLFLLCLINKDGFFRRKILIAFCVGLILIANFFRFYLSSHNFGFNIQVTFFRADGLLFGVLLKLIEQPLFSLSQKMRLSLSWMSLFSGLCLYSWLMYKNYNLFTFWPTLGLAYLAPGCLILSALLGCQPLNRFLEVNVLRWIGKNSYGIYLWHYILIFLFAKNVYLLGVLPTAILYVLFSILIGFLSTITIEKYFLNLRKMLIPSISTA